MEAKSPLGGTPLGGGHNWAYLTLPAVDNFKLIRQGVAAMRPLIFSTDYYHLFTITDTSCG